MVPVDSIRAKSANYRCLSPASTMQTRGWYFKFMKDNTCRKKLFASPRNNNKNPEVQWCTLHVWWQNGMKASVPNFDILEYMASPPFCVFSCPKIIFFCSYYFDCNSFGYLSHHCTQLMLNNVNCIEMIGTYQINFAGVFFICEQCYTYLIVHVWITVHSIYP